LAAAFLNNGGTITLTNSTFSGNTAPNGAGGGIANFVDGTLTITNSTFSDNSANDGGSIDNGFGTANLKGTILAASSGGNCLGSITDQGYNLSDDASCVFSATGSQNSVSDTQLNLGPLHNNGGPTQTIALGAGSMAIDKIPVADCTDQSLPPKRITTDQRGFPRPDSGENICDIGAYESQESFAGTPGAPNCYGKSVSALSNQFGTLNAAASALGFSSVQALQNAITAFCAR